MASSADVIIVGGGAIGCAIAYFLARAGVKCTVVERSTIGGEASTAAAGMLAPLGESSGPGPFLDLGLKSLALYPSLAKELKETSGIDIEYDPCGILWAALSQQESSQLQDRLSWQRTLGLGVKFLNEPDLKTYAPYLGRGVHSGVLSPLEGHVDGLRLTRALAQAARSLGAQVLEGSEVTSLLIEDTKVKGVRVHGEHFWAGHVLLTTGAWAVGLGQSLGIPLPVRPVKGQILSLRPTGTRIPHIVFGGHGYLVPKGDGSLWVGATQEEAGFDKKVTVDGVRYLLDKACTLMPSLASATVERAWAGLRPGSPDGMPILGPVPGWEGITLAMGHFRNGILLAPITGQLITKAITSGETAPLLPFSPSRFKA